jgi:hypothetical protein
MSSAFSQPATSSGVVKDYQMPANKQRLADYHSVWGRRRIILRGGNRGVEADVAGWFSLSYGDLKSLCLIYSDRNDDSVSQAP